MLLCSLDTSGKALLLGDQPLPSLGELEWRHAGWPLKHAHVHMAFSTETTFGSSWVLMVCIEVLGVCPLDGAEHTCLF